MSLFDYHASRAISEHDPPFYALIMSAMRKADTTNAAKLRLAFPDTWRELQARYDAPGGLLTGEVQSGPRSVDD
jgi:hypothetical protein